jgi:hypothetical protein
MLISHCFTYTKLHHDTQDKSRTEWVWSSYFLRETMTICTVCFSLNNKALIMMSPSLKMTDFSSSHHQIACFKAMKGLHLPYCAARSQWYSVASFDMLQVLSCLYLPVLCCLYCNTKFLLWPWSMQFADVSYRLFNVSTAEVIQHWLIIKAE